MVHHYKKIKILFFLTILLFISLTPLHSSKGQAKETINEIISGEKSERAIAAGRAGYNIKVDDPVELRAIYLKAVLSFLGVIFLALIIYGGFIWMNAQGNADEAGKAKSIIINASIGLIIILASYAISDYIIRNLITVAT